MRFGAFQLRALILGSLAALIALVPAVGLADATDTSLGSGPNGPVPAIVVDQFGYLPNSRKVAILRSPQVGYDREFQFTPGAKIALIDTINMKVVKEGAPEPWSNGATDPMSGDKAWWFDFSDVTTPGRYVVKDMASGKTSPEFRIGGDIYRNVMKHAIRMFFYQRAGFEKRPQYAGIEWADRASHLGPGQDSESLPWPGTVATTFFGSSDAKKKDLRGGWYDAGDFNKYTNWTTRNIIVMLRAFEENPEAFRDDLGLPESDNGVPDLLDEIKWGLDWLVRMQNEDGSVLCVQALAGASPPSRATGPSYYGPATTSATLSTAAVFAYAAKIYGARSEENLKAFAADLKKRAKSAWDWAVIHPNVVYFNNDEARQPGSGGLAAGQQEMNERDRVNIEIEAAIYLYDLTGDPALRAIIDAYYTRLVPATGPSEWDTDGLDALLYLANLKSTSPELKAKIEGDILGHLTPQVVGFEDQQAGLDPYRSYMKDFTWGSTKGKALKARLYQLTALVSEDADVKSKARSAAENFVHYIHGANPLGLVYLTTMSSLGATHSVTTMFHAWFNAGWPRKSVKPGEFEPPPGYVVGGPNPQFTLDACCSNRSGGHACFSEENDRICKQNFYPPLGQPPAKSFLMFNTGWPANSWQITEPSQSYQIYYIRLLASFAR